jgi:hypothetical protein
MASEALNVLFEFAVFDFKKAVGFYWRLLGQRLVRGSFGQFNWVFSIVVLIDLL